MEDIFERLYDMTAFSNIIAEPQSEQVMFPFLVR